MDEQFWLVYEVGFTRDAVFQMQRRERDAMLERYIEDQKAKAKAWNS